MHVVQKLGYLYFLTMDDRGSRVRFPAGGWEFFSSPPRPERLWGPSSLLSNGYQGLFPGGKAAGAWGGPLTSIKCRGQRIRRGIPLLPQYVFMVRCLVMYRDNFTFTFYLAKHTRLSLKAVLAQTQYSPQGRCFARSRNRRHRPALPSGLRGHKGCDTQTAISCSATPCSRPSCLQESCPLPRSRWVTQMIDRSARKMITREAKFEVFTAVKIHVEICCVVTACNWRWRRRGPPKRWYPTETPDGNTTQRTSTWIGLKTTRGLKDNTSALGHIFVKSAGTT
jgi:hypothetical protein